MIECNTTEDLAAVATSQSAFVSTAPTSVGGSDDRNDGNLPQLVTISWDDATWVLTSSFIIFTMQSGEPLTL